LTIYILYGNILLSKTKEVIKWKNDIESTLQKLINETLELRRMWNQRYLEAENQIKALDAKLTAYQTALKDCWEHIDSKDIDQGI